MKYCEQCDYSQDDSAEQCIKCGCRQFLLFSRAWRAANAPSKSNALSRFFIVILVLVGTFAVAKLAKWLEQRSTQKPEFLAGGSVKPDRDRILELERETQSLTERVKSLQEEVESFKTQSDLDEVIANERRMAYLTPGKDGYSVIESDIVKLTVSLENVQPYANGSRVILRFGNVSSATINDLKGTIEWGKVDETGLPQNSKAKSRDITLNKPLRPGSWTNVPVVLETVPAGELGFVRVRNLRHKGISLIEAAK